MVGLSDVHANRAAQNLRQVICAKPACSESQLPPRGVKVLTDSDRYWYAARSWASNARSMAPHGKNRDRKSREQPLDGETCLGIRIFPGRRTRNAWSKKRQIRKFLKTNALTTPSKTASLNATVSRCRGQSEIVHRAARCILLCASRISEKSRPTIRPPPPLNAEKSGRPSLPRSRMRGCQRSKCLNRLPASGCRDGADHAVKPIVTPRNPVEHMLHGAVTRVFDAAIVC
jgi:hypothetical protein